ncbi:hypothetical protein F8271_12845 [Micromonospora sp. ALFpr18c]|uniref:hypothetical protein n=1 Tax=unclassified Micromonospora TaxID=2617518 RepID=UPI00124B1672|nr:hypothetical protein [Micromonospora sp. ALFpr18c]KAB1942320.1 hypothetical protein F8271_12845 [Micromonospora sp. ALFpr18c]
MIDGVQRPAPRRLWPLWTAFVVIVLVLGCGLPALLVVGVVREAGGRPTISRIGAPATDDPATAVARGLSDRMTAQLRRQSSALLGGDRAGYLAVAEPAAHTDLRRRFAALRALKVTVWRAEPSGLPVPVVGKAGEWRLLVRFQYCFVAPGCQPSPVLIGTRWRENGDQPLLVALEESKSAETGTRPWEISDLAVAVGPRTIVATTPALRAKLPGLLTQAEAAARVADGYVAAGSPPDRYRIFYAGRTEWQRWYGGGRPQWTGGYAVTVGGGHHEVVLNAEGLTSSGADELLRHELTHAASLPERGYPGKLTWWLVEGLAEFAGAGGRPVERYEGLAEVRKLVRGGWDGQLDGVTPADDASAERVGGSYGIGYLAVRHLVDRYGSQRVLAFFKTVVHERRTLDVAARQAFGEQWSTLHDECVAYVRATAA